MTRPLFRLPVFALGLLMMTACASSVQTTSGAEYLSRYDGSYQIDTAQPGSDVDADVRRIAAIEPDLRFPARIGLARIGAHGGLATVPAEELAIWSDLAGAMGTETGDFVPVNPMIAAMVSDPGVRGTAETISHIRRGAARQHIDYVLVYETASTGDDRANGLALADLTVIGMFVLPSRNVEVEASASAILLDVRNGYPYATLTAHAETRGMSRAVSTWSKQRALSADAETKAVMELAEDVRETITKLAITAATDKQE